MGSFIFNLHVRSSDHDDVARRIEELVSHDGLVPAGVADGERTLFVTESQRDWVSILDSDLTSAVNLAAGLSQALQTEAICVLVNDSDSWHYLLYRDGEQIDEFNSAELDGPDEVGELSPDLAQLLDAGQLEKFRTEIQQRAAELQKQLEALVPPHIRERQERIARGEGTAADFDAVELWSGQALPGLADQILSLSGSIVKPKPADPEATPPGLPPESDKHAEDRLRGHIAKLRALIPPGISNDFVLRILRKQPVFAEEALAEFLPVLGIPPIYAYLQGSDVDSEFERDELRTESVKFAAELRFRGA